MKTLIFSIIFLILTVTNAQSQNHTFHIYDREEMNLIYNKLYGKNDPMKLLSGNEFSDYKCKSDFGIKAIAIGYNEKTKTILCMAPMFSQNICNSFGLKLKSLNEETGQLVCGPIYDI